MSGSPLVPPLRLGHHRRDDTISLHHCGLSRCFLSTCVFALPVSSYPLAPAFRHAVVVVQHDTTSLLNLQTMSSHCDGLSCRAAPAESPSCGPVGVVLKSLVRYRSQSNPIASIHNSTRTSCYFCCRDLENQNSIIIESLGDEAETAFAIFNIAKQYLLWDRFISCFTAFPGFHNCG